MQQLAITLHALHLSAINTTFNPSFPTNSFCHTFFDFMVIFMNRNSFNNNIHFYWISNPKQILEIKISL